jgi:sulfur carrier protein
MRALRCRSEFTNKPDSPVMSAAPIQVVVNGESRSLAGRMPLPALVAQLQLGERRVAVELNGAIVPRSRWAEITLGDGDRLEIVQAIGGG